MDCQLMTLAEAGRRPPVWRRLSPRYIRQTLWRVVTDPAVLLRKLRAVVTEARADRASHEAARARSPSVVLGLQPGERVWVKSADEIRATLDATGRTERMAYMPTVMDKYCGEVYTVRKRVDRFFDERHWRPVTLRNVVILDEVFCQPAPDDKHAWAGCDRTCFLFWKEAWLERVLNEERVS